MDSRLIKVMLVDDDDDDHMIIRNMLAESAMKPFDVERVDVERASQWQEALKKAERNSYDVILLDYRLGNQNGIDLMNLLRQKGLNVPMIILTGNGTPEIDLRAMNAGADDYLDKSDLNPNMIARCIRYAIERSKTKQTLQESEKRLQALNMKLVDAQESERKRVAQELHDSIGASLTAVKYALEAKRDHLANPSSTPNGISLDSIISMIRDTIEETRRIATNLRPAILDDIGILKTVDWLCRTFQESYPDIRIQKHIDCKESDIPDPLKIVLYRVLQEALNNVFKHSEAKRVEITLSRTEGGTVLAVADDGRGFDVSGAHAKDGSTGRGIGGMRDRISLSSGRFEIFSQKGKGTRVQAFWASESPEAKRLKCNTRRPPSRFRNFPLLPALQISI